MIIRLLHLFIIISAIVCTIALSAIALTPSANAKTAEQRQLEKYRKIFPKAEYAARQRKSRDYKIYHAQLEGYVLQPYIEYTYLRKHTYWRNRKQIREFLAKYENTPMEWPLRKKWLHYLAGRDKKDDFLADYKPNNDTTLHCYQLRYTLAKGGSETGVFTQVDKLWVHKKSQPKACDPLFKLWQEAGWRSNDKIWARLVLAASKGDHTLIPYLKRLSPVDEKYLADLWYKMRRWPAHVAKMSNFPGKNPKEKAIALYAVKRLAWKDKDLALRAWERLTKKFTFTADEKNEVAKVFARRLAQVGHDKAPQWLKKIPTNELTDELVQWRIADALRRNQWQDALEILETLPGYLAKKESWSYWLARALEQTGKNKDADKQFKLVAQERHYYGFLAATLIGQAPNLGDKPLQFSESELTAIDNNPAAQRALEFRHLKRWAQARREWFSFTKQLPTRQQLAAAKWANQNDWPDRAIFTLAEHKYWDDVALRFPLAFKSTVDNHAKRNKVEPEFAFAIARRESSFMPDANSSAGALGLMQLLPSTAKYVAKKKVARNKLFNANTNVKYGTQYLKYLLDRLDGNEIAAAAAYNAGIHRVQRWVKVDQPMPADIWIETIPFKETRNYVKSVMAYRQIYSELLGQKHNTFKPLTQMKIGKQIPSKNKT